MSRQRDEIKEIILQALHQIAPEIESDEVDANESLQDQFELDSMDFLRLMVLLNKKLKIEVPESDYSKLATLTQCTDYFVERLSI